MEEGDKLYANTVTSCELPALEETQSCDLVIENVSIYNKGLLADSVENTLPELLYQDNPFQKVYFRIYFKQKLHTYI